MRRATIAAVLAIALLAGCSSLGSWSSPPEDCRATDSGTYAEFEGSACRDYPDKPDAIDRSSVREYVEAFERAYAWNRMYAPTQEELHVTVHGIDVELRDDGYVVHVDEVRISQYLQDNTIADDAWSAHYFVNDSVVERAEGNAYGPVPDKSERETVRQW